MGSWTGVQLKRDYSRATAWKSTIQLASKCASSLEPIRHVSTSCETSGLKLYIPAILNGLYQTIRRFREVEDDGGSDVVFWICYASEHSHPLDPTKVRLARFEMEAFASTSRRKPFLFFVHQRSKGMYNDHTVHIPYLR